jgi:hypothetical protein
MTAVNDPVVSGKRSRRQTWMFLVLLAVAFASGWAVGARWHQQRPTTLLACVGITDPTAVFSLVIDGDRGEVVTAAQFALSGAVTTTAGTWTLRAASLGSFSIDRVTGRMMWNSLEGGADGRERIYQCRRRRAEDRL